MKKVNNCRVQMEITTVMPMGLVEPFALNSTLWRLTSILGAQLLTTVKNKTSMASSQIVTQKELLMILTSGEVETMDPVAAKSTRLLSSI